MNFDAVLRAGVGRADITPAPGTPQGGWGAQTHERGSGADMPMLVTALALEQDAQQVLILDMDAIGFDREWSDRIIYAVAQLTGLAQQSIRFSCTHTHSGPNTFRLKNISDGLDMVMEYLEALPGRIAGAAWQALQQMQPVRVATNTGNCFINRNRRVVAPSGETVVGVNEAVACDSSLGLMRFDQEDGTPLATVLHYACHPTTIAWQSDKFTPDYPGVARQVVEKEIGGVCIFLQGAAGDLGPRRGFTGDLKVYRALGHELGLTAAALAAGTLTAPDRLEFGSLMPSGANIALYRSIPVATDQTLQVRDAVMHLPVKALPSQKELEAQISVLREEVNALRIASRTEELRLLQAKATQMGWRLENARLYGGLSTTPWPLQVIRIGDTALVSMPGEPFSSIATRIREFSKATHTFVSGYSNGGFGYIPDREAYVSGGYEVEATPFSPDAADIVVEEALHLISEMFSGEITK